MTHVPIRASYLVWMVSMLMCMCIAVAKNETTVASSQRLGPRTGSEADSGARRRRRNRERALVRSVMRDGSSDLCSLLARPLDFFSGRPCGAHYKVLGLYRTAASGDLKRAYRARSVLLHPDKNPDGSEAFRRVSEAYECLSSEKCRREYDASLDTHQAETRARIRTHLRHLLIRIHGVVSLCARQYYLVGTALWDWLEAITIDVPSFESPIPAGRAVLMLFLLLRARILLFLYIASVNILKLNYKIAVLMEDRNRF
jgi:hypothetical protein